MPNTKLILNPSGGIIQVLHEEDDRHGHAEDAVLMSRAEMTSMFGAVGRDKIVAWRQIRPRRARPTNLHPELIYTRSDAHKARRKRKQDVKLGRHKGLDPHTYFYNATNDIVIQQGDPITFPDSIMFKLVPGPYGDYRLPADPSDFTHLGIDFYGPTTASDALSRVINPPEEEV